VSVGNDDARFARLTLEQQEARAADARIAARIKERERRELAESLAEARKSHQEIHGKRPRLAH